MMSNTLSPKTLTIFRAYTGPMPRIMPEDRYFSIPSVESGWRRLQKPRLELLAMRAIIHPLARAVIHSPAEMTAA